MRDRCKACEPAMCDATADRAGAHRIREKRAGHSNCAGGGRRNRQLRFFAGLPRDLTLERPRFRSLRGAAFPIISSIWLSPGNSLPRAITRARLARTAMGGIAAARPYTCGGGRHWILFARIVGRLSHGPVRNRALRERLERREQKRPLSLHRILTRLDPAAASRIHANDRKKIIRALEVRTIGRPPISELFSRGRDPLTGFRPIKLGLNPPRALLNQRLDARTACMFRSRLDQGSADYAFERSVSGCKPFESLGYKQALQVMEGRMTWEQALESTQLQTRRYAKRQTHMVSKGTGCSMAGRLRRQSGGASAGLGDGGKKSAILVFFYFLTFPVRVTKPISNVLVSGSRPAKSES